MSIIWIYRYIFLYSIANINTIFWFYKKIWNKNNNLYLQKQESFIWEQWFCFNNKSNSNETKNLVCGLMNGACLVWFTLLAFIFCNNNYPSMKASYVKESVVFLFCNFTIKRSSKIFEIEKINRQALYKNGLILTKKTDFKAETLT